MEPAAPFCVDDHELDFRKLRADRHASNSCAKLFEQEVQERFQLDEAAAEDFSALYFDWLRRRGLRTRLDVSSLLAQEWNASTAQDMADLLNLWWCDDEFDLGRVEDAHTCTQFSPINLTPYYEYVPGSEEKNNGDKNASGQAGVRRLNDALGPFIFTTSDLLSPGDPPQSLSQFTTKLVHFGSIFADIPRKGSYPLLYAAVGKIGGDNRIDGVFAIPIHGSPVADSVDEDVEVWEPERRGVYYLGPTLDDCRERDWQFRFPIEKLEVVALDKQDACL